MRLDSNLRKTNPVFYFRELFAREMERDDGRNPGLLVSRYQEVFEEMLEDGITFPSDPSIHGRFNVRDLQLGKSPAGAIGVLVDESTGQGFTTEIRVEPAEQWDVAVNLPFNKEHVIDALSRLQRHVQTGCLTSGLTPLSINDTLNSRSYGASMDITVVMSIVAKMNEGSDTTLLDYICCLAQPGDGDKLDNVGHANAKLEAFFREYGAGTLLIYHADLHEEIKEIVDKSWFECVWVVSSYQDLANYLQQAGLVNGLFRQEQLSAGECSAIQSQLEYYKTLGEHRLPDAEKLIDSAMSRWNQQTPFSFINTLAREKEQLLRRQGKFIEALDFAKQYNADSRRNLHVSYQQEIERDIQFAASLYDAHEFYEAHMLLDKCCVNYEEQPKIVDAETAVKLFNTAGRVLAQLNQPGWEKLFRRSLQIQEIAACSSVHRTRNYLIKAMLSSNRLSEAEEELQVSERHLTDMDPDSRDHYDFHMAEVHRRRGKEWWPKWIAQGDTLKGHAKAFCLQAVARQAGMGEERAVLFSRAATAIAPPAHDSTSVRRFLCICFQCGQVVAAGESLTGREPLEQLGVYISNAPTAFRRFYEAEVDALLNDPGMPQVETLFERIPYL